MRAAIEAENNILVYKTPYDPDLVVELKARVPAVDRKWDPTRKVWFIGVQYGQILVDLAREYLGEELFLPKVKQPESEIKIFELHYIGQTKPRDGFDQRTAIGMKANGEWGVLFTEDILITFFTGLTSGPEAAQTLYGVLGITRLANPDEIKSSYRRMARQWHPDVCLEPDAHERFLKIKDAYDVLNNENKRARYDAGLKLEESLKNKYDVQTRLTLDGYKPPLRCGYIQVEGVQTPRFFLVTKILNWLDITDNAGRTLVTSWPAGSDRIKRSWV